MPWFSAMTSTFSATPTITTVIPVKRAVHEAEREDEHVGAEQDRETEIVEPVFGEVDELEDELDRQPR